MKHLKYVRRHYRNSPKSGLVYCFSSYELKAAIILDNDENVISYKTQISFVNSDGKKRFIDFLVVYKDHSCIIEVKPESRLDTFKEQIDDNREYAAKHGYKFSLWTESELGFASAYFAQKWADEYISKLTGIDYVSLRKERNLEKVKRYYQKTIATDKIDVYCEYCKETHTPLRLTHDRNIAKNGRHICEREGGHIAGSKPKKKKDNPHVSEGKKQCTKCSSIKLFNEFGTDKSRSDGYSNRCLKCRAEIALTKYYVSKKDSINVADSGVLGSRDIGLESDQQFR